MSQGFTNGITFTFPITLGQGGTNAALTASNGGIFYSTASAGAILAGTATAGLALLSGANTAPTWSVSKPITQIGLQTFVSVGANTYTPTAGTTLAWVELWAAGSGGSSSNSATIFGNGGGAGAYSARWISNPVSVTISIGTGGNGANANSGSNATDGGDTTYNSTDIVAKGGTHPANGAGTGGAGGLASGGAGDLKLNGGQGNGNPQALAGIIPHGGSSPRNIPLPSLASAGATAAPANSGGGGSAGNSATAGGAGALGYAVVTEFRSA